MIAAFSFSFIFGSIRWYKKTAKCFAEALLVSTGPPILFSASFYHTLISNASTRGLYFHALFTSMSAAFGLALSRRHALEFHSSFPYFRKRVLQKEASFEFWRFSLRHFYGRRNDSRCSSTFWWHMLYLYFRWFHGFFKLAFSTHGFRRYYWHYFLTNTLN